MQGDFILEGKAKYGGGPSWGLWAWVLQRVSAVAMAATVAIHLWLTHWAQAGRVISFEEVSRRLQSPFFSLVDGILLAAALYHALYGIRGILWELGIGPQAPRLFLALYIMAGLVVFLFGVNALLPFIFKMSFF